MVTPESEDISDAEKPIPLNVLVPKFFLWGWAQGMEQDVFQFKVDKY